jgi:hypothetical protein
MEEKNVTLMITLKKEDRDLLRKMAAEQNLKNLNDVTSAAQIARVIIENNLTQKKNEKNVYENTN